MITTIEQFLKNANPSRNGGGKSPDGNVQFPGSQFGYNIGQLRDFIKTQKRSKGYNIQTIANTTKDTKLDISGTANLLLGFNLAINDNNLTNLGSYRCSLLVNEEIIFEDISAAFLNPQTNFHNEEYFPYPRPLSGSDVVIFTIKAGANADLINLQIYYI